MKVSRNTTINVVHSSSYKSTPKPPKSSSSSASSRPSKSSSSSVNNVSPKPAKSSGASPSKTGQSGNVQPKTLKPGSATSKDTKTSTVQSKPVKQGTGPVPQNTAKTVTKHLPGHHMEKTGTNSQVSKKDNKASETVVLKKTVSKRDSATSKTIEVKNVASKKDSSTSKAVETKKVTTGKVDNRSYVKDVSVTKPANVVKTGRMVSVIGGYNSKKDNNTDKRKKADNKQSASSIRRGDYNSARIMQNKGITARVLANKSGITQTLNSSAITVPKEFIPKGKKSDGILQTISYLLNDAGKAGKELLSDMVKMALEQGDKLAKTVSNPKFRENAHNFFAAAGMLCPIGDVADVALYLAEKNNKEALMALAAVIPVGDAIKVAKNGVKFFGKQGEKLAVKVVKSESKVLKGEAKKVIKTKSKETAKIVNKDVGKQAKIRNKTSVENNSPVKAKQNEKTVEKTKKKVRNNSIGQYANESERFKKWKIEADKNPSEIKNRIFEKLENYWDTTKDTTDTVINLERQGDYKTAVEEFYEFADKKTVSVMNRKGKENGLIGNLDGKLHNDMDNNINITVRPDSKTGGATVEIKIDNERTFKIRYKEDFSIESK